MATISAPASVTPAGQAWIRPGTSMNDLSDYLKPLDGLQDIMETAGNVFDWMAHLDFNASLAGRASTDLNRLNQGLSVPAFFASLGSLRNSIQRFGRSDESNVREIWDNSMVTMIHGTKSCMALDSWGVCSFKNSMKGIKTYFWTALIGLDALVLRSEIIKVGHLQKTIESTHDMELKEILAHKLQKTYLNVLQNAIIVVAMAPLCLISILFASIAHGILFHPAVMLSLTSAWCALSFVNYFYDRAIERWETEYHSIKG